MKHPEVRMRRLRENRVLRSFLSEHRLEKRDLVQPIFVKEALARPVEIASMPGQFQFPLRHAVDEALRVEGAGIGAVVLFGIPEKKDLKGLEAFAKNGVVQRAVAEIKRRRRDLLVVTDVCLCEYLSHGHCGHVKNGRVANDATLETLAKVSLSHARAGADVIAPSDMMDGRVAAIRRTLDKNGFESTPILSYAVKYASAFYSPFREAAESAPAFGDRASYQMNPANSDEAIREAATDLEEGADMLLVKPAIAYGDVIRRLKDRFSCPVGAYSVSGEYAMIKAASRAGWLDEKRTALETHLSLKRAGASFIVTYYAKELAEWGV